LKYILLITAYKINYQIMEFMKKGTLSHLKYFKNIWMKLNQKYVFSKILFLE